MTAERKARQPVPPLPPLRGTLGQRAPTPPSSPHWLWIPQWTTHSSFPVPLFMTHHPLKQHVSVCVRVCAWVHECVCLCASLEQLSLGEYINVSAWRYHSLSVCLSALWVSCGSDTPEQVWKGHTSVWQLFFTVLHQRQNLGQLNYTERGRVHENDGWRRKLWVITKLGMR